MASDDSNRPGPAAELQVVGGGRMGEALVAGWLASGQVGAAGVRVVEVDPERRGWWNEHFPEVRTAVAPGPAAGTVLAVKPADAAAVAADVAAAAGGRVLSIAAGVRLATLEAAVGTSVAVVRAMPNTPALVGAGVAAVCGGSAAGEDDLAWAESLLSAVGVVVRVPETLLDAVTAISGSGPAYVFLFTEALVDAGVLAGLSRPMAEQLAIQTVLGSARLLAEGDASASELRAAVTSPGGTTAAALRVLEQRGLRGAVLDAVIAARDRSAELA